MFQKIHARYEERGLVPRQGPASAAGVMGMKVDERHRQGELQTPRQNRSKNDGNTKTTEDNIKESAASNTAVATSDASALVGEGELIIESSICVATTTGFPNSRDF